MRTGDVHASRGRLPLNFNALKWNGYGKDRCKVMDMTIQVAVMMRVTGDR